MSLMTKRDVALSGERSETKVSGLALCRFSPVGKLDVLVIDDKARRVAAELNANPQVNGVLHFDALELKPGKGIVDELCAGLARIRAAKLSYGFVLLGLRFGEEEGEDFSGYLLQPYLRRYLPMSAVIVYSAFDDMGHVARAFQNGALWFLRKNEIHDLPRHLLSIIVQRPWKREWSSVLRQDLVAFEFLSCQQKEAFEAAFDAPRRYLTYKAMAGFPGRTICVKPMGGGFSNSATFMAVKSDGPGRGYTQVPVVVKISPHFDAMMEYERYTRFIRPYIPNDSGRVEERERVIDREHAVITYSFAGSQSDSRDLKPLKTLLIDALKKPASLDYEKFRPVFDQVFGEILPKIHRVRPEIEFGERSERSSFPNSDLGEVAPGNFIGNWLCRIPVACKIENVTFARQEDAAKNKNLVGFEFFSAYEEHGRCRIEVVDEDKTTVILEGPGVDDAVRRRDCLRPGLTLWIDMSQHVLTPLRPTERICSMLHGDWPEFKELGKMIGRIRRLVADDPRHERFRCPVGIIHGDMNFANVMVEQRKNLRQMSSAEAWLIDFGRTRRDVIVHDYSVMFTSALGLWFRPEGLNKAHLRRLMENFESLVVGAAFAKRNALAPDLRKDRRIAFVYAMLRHIRHAALAAGVSSDMFALSSVLAMLVAFRISIQYEKNTEAAKAMLLAAIKCLEKLERGVCNR